MSHNNFVDQYTRIKDFVTKYLSLKGELLKLNILEKSTMILGHFVLLIICLLLACFALLAFSFALAYLLGAWLNNFFIAFIIVAGLYILLIALIYAFRFKIIINPILRALERMLFLNDEENDIE